MYSGGFYPYETLEEYWAWWSRHIYCNRYDQPQNEVYQMLLKLIHGKDYFVLATNVDHLFQINHFDKRDYFTHRVIMAYGSVQKRVIKRRMIMSSSPKNDCRTTEL